MLPASPGPSNAPSTTTRYGWYASGGLRYLHPSFGTCRSFYGRVRGHGSRSSPMARMTGIACLEAVEGFAPAAVGLARSSVLFSTCAISLRGGSGLVAAQVARHGGQYRPGKSKVARTSGCSSARKEHEDVGAATSLRRGRSARSAPLFAHDARDLIKLQQRFPVSDIQRPFSSSPWRAHEEEMLEAFMVRRGGCARACCVAATRTKSYCQLAHGGMQRWPVGGGKRGPHGAVKLLLPRNSTRTETV